MTAPFNIREQEVVSVLGNHPQFKSLVLDHAMGPYAAPVRLVLAAMATALDFRRQHPNPANVPFGARKRREEIPVFFLGCAYIVRDYICVVVHADGWVALFATAVTTQTQQYEHERNFSMVADWEATSVPWLAMAIEPDRRRAIKLPGADGVSGYDLYPYFLDQAYATPP